MEVTHASTSPVPSDASSPILLVKLVATALPSSGDRSSDISMDIHVDGTIYPSIPIDSDGAWSFEKEVEAPPEIEERFRTVAKVPRDGVMVVVVARCGDGGCGKEAGVVRVL